MLKEFTVGMRSYILFITMAAGLWLGATSLSMDIGIWPHLLFFCLILIVVEVVPLGLSFESGAGFGSAVDLAGLLLFGPGPAAWVSLVGRSVAALALRESAWGNPYPKDVSFYKISHAVLAVQASGLAYLFFGGGFMMMGGESNLTAIAAMAITYFAVYWTLAGVAYSLRYRTTFVPRREVRDSARILMAFGLSLLFAFTYFQMQVGLFGVLLFVLFLLMVMYASRLFVDMKAVYWGTVRGLMTTVESKDPYGRGHSDGVALYAVAISRKMFMTEREVIAVHWAASLHDIGTVGIDERILQKEGPLCLEEFGIVAEHPEKGYELFREIPFLKEIAGPVRFHHERYDGSGYPKGIQGEAIPLAARILAVAETYHALTSSRSYRRAFSPEEAKKEVQSLAGTALDPRVAKGFLQVWEDEMRWGKIVFHRHYRLDANGPSRWGKNLKPGEDAHQTN